MRFLLAGVMVLGALIYVGIFAGWLNEIPNSFVPIFIGWNALLLISTILAIIDSVKTVRAGTGRQLADAVFVAKLAAIPFFLINFAVLALIALGGTVLLIKGIGLAILFVVAIAAALTYLTMISTSVYGWGSIVQLRRAGIIGSTRAVIYSALLLIFVADTAVGILLFVHSRRRNKAIVAEPLAA